uniref:Peptidase M12B domain-containing protein n=1 Tax=Globodera rostochiensis TaxID=31243 RepID=A0A914HP31_GLORO
MNRIWSFLLMSSAIFIRAQRRCIIHPLPFLIIFILIIRPLTAFIEHDRLERDDVVFPKQQQFQREHRHHRLRRAPAVWGEPAPDYSAVNLNTSSTTFFLYALLFVDLKTSDHYRREHEVVKREVIRLANEANNYFFQINIRLLVVDILETFRDDLSSLYTFEKYRNQRAAQLPFHNVAVLISHRYAGGLAFIGGMCTGRNVMMAGFYPHNPEAMAPIFFHEVAHLIGVPHRPLNETFAIPNCACPRAAHKASSDGTFRIANQPFSSLPSANNISSTFSGVAMSEPNLTVATAGCLKIPGFDHDCSLQWMQVQSNLTTLALCGNGVLEAEEQCDCGLSRMCAEWNCEAQNCSLKWPLRTMLILIICVVVALFLLPFGWLCLQRNSVTSEMNCLARMGNRRQKLMWQEQFIPQLVLRTKRHKSLAPGIRQKPFWHQWKRKTLTTSKKNSSTLADATFCAFIKTNNKEQRHSLKGKNPIRTIWRRFRATLSRKRNSVLIKQLETRATGVVIRRPIRPPPPPPICADTFPQSSYSGRPSSSLHQQPKVQPLPVPQANLLPIVRPRAPPPEPPRQSVGEEEEEWESEEDEWDSDWN